MRKIKRSKEPGVSVLEEVKSWEKEDGILED
jgi:hypothetical protein